MKKNKVIVIAEAGVNHNGKIYLAKTLIKIAKKCGADYIKFQMFKTDEHVTRNALQAKYQITNLKKKTNQYDMIKKLEFSAEEFKHLHNYSKKIKIKFLASCFDIKSLDQYSKFKPDFYKIPSGEITNLPLLEALGKKNKRILLSTGMATFDEVRSAIKTLVKNGCSLKNITVLQCTTDYPCKINDVNLLVIPEFIKRFKCNVGFSDHTITNDVAISAISLGAKVVEKHITTNNSLTGPDHKASLNPEDFKIFVNKIRNLEKAFGTNRKFPSKNEKKNIILVRKSIVAVKNINKGEKFTKFNIGVKRPANGLSPMKINLLYERVAKKKYRKNEKI